MHIKIKPVVSLTIAAIASFVGHSVLAQPAKLDPDMQGVISELEQLGGKAIETLSAKEARKQPTPADAVKKYLKKTDVKAAKPRVSDDNKSIKGPAGDIKIRVYTPEGRGNGPFPLIVYYHGGGFVIADLDVYDSTPRSLADAAGAVVVSSHYRQGPENKFPAAHDDAFATYKWTLANATSLKGDPQRVAVVGESAGGNLACAVSMMARDNGVALPKHQVLVYPVVDNDMNTPSYMENADAKPLNKAMMGWFFQNAAAPDDIKNPYLGQLKNGKLSGLPATTIITAQVDPLRSEGEAFAQKLRAAGVKVNAKYFDGVTHEFFGMSAAVAKAKQAQDLAVGDLKTAFGR